MDATYPWFVWQRPSPQRMMRRLLTAGEHSELDGQFLDALVAAVTDIRHAVAELQAFAAIARGQDQARFET